GGLLMARPHTFVKPSVKHTVVWPPLKQLALTGSSACVLFASFAVSLPSLAAISTLFGPFMYLPVYFPISAFPGADGEGATTKRTARSDSSAFWAMGAGCAPSLLQSTITPALNSGAIITCDR